MSVNLGVAEQIEEAKKKVDDWPTWMTSSYRRENVKSEESGNWPEKKNGKKKNVQSNNKRSEL